MKVLGFLSKKKSKNLVINLVLTFFRLTYYFFISLVITIHISNTSQSQVIDSEFYRWQVHEMEDEPDSDFKKCYIVNYPTSTDSDHSSRFEPYIMITRYQKDRIEEVSIFGGFEYKLGSKIFVLIDDLQFQMKAKGNLAWSKTRYEDVRMIGAFLNGGVARVRSDSSIGKYAIDEYSLKGITRAYQRMREICS